MSLDRETNAVYEAGAATYAARDTRPEPGPPTALVAASADGPILDLGCGPGWHLPLLGDRAIGADPAAAMLGQARATAPGRALVRAAAGALPVEPQSLGGVWACKSLQHLAAEHLPLALADLHRSLPVGAPLAATLFAGEGSLVAHDGDLPGRRFSLWAPEVLTELLEGAGFTDVSCDLAPGPEQPDTTPTPPSARTVVTSDRATDSAPAPWTRLHLTATRARTLPDTVGPDMRLLVCGLNPSLNAADAGVGFAGPGNRFWPALGQAGLLPEGVDRDPWGLLRHGKIGMTDMVKRATPRAAELTTAEHRAGLGRLDRLCALLEPESVVIVGLAGWRAAVDRKAKPGWQEGRLGPSPVHLMPSTSGLNAGTPLATLVDHLRAATAPR
ncbi:MAG: uracil-DNA glycosylase family protein [Iamia sp.]